MVGRTDRNFVESTQRRAPSTTRSEIQYFLLLGLAAHPKSIFFGNGSSLMRSGTVEMPTLRLTDNVTRFSIQRRYFLAASSTNSNGPMGILGLGSRISPTLPIWIDCLS